MYRYILILIQHQEMERCGSVKESFEELLFTLHQLLHPSHYMIIKVHINCAKKGMNPVSSLCIWAFRLGPIINHRQRFNYTT